MADRGCDETVRPQCRLKARVITHSDLDLLSVPTFILFIKGTFHRISPLSFCPSPATIHFNSAPVRRRGFESSQNRPSRASHSIIQFIRKPARSRSQVSDRPGNSWWLMCSLNILNMEIGGVMDYRYPLACPSPAPLSFMSAV